MSVRSLALLALLLLATPANAARVEGEVHADEATFQGVRFDGPALFFGALRSASGEARASFSLTAESMDVVVHRQRYVATPVVEVDPDVGTPDQGTETDPPVRHDHVRAATPRTGFAAFVQAEGLDGPGGEPTFHVSDAVERLRPRADLDFRRAEDSGSEWQPFRHGPWPNLEALQSGAGPGPVTLRGDLILTLYDVDLAVQAEDGNTTYRTGRVVENRTEVDGVGTVSSDGETRRADLHLRNATLTYHPAGQPYQFNVPGGALSGDGRLRLEGAEGSLHAGGRSVPVHDRVELDARLDAKVRLEDSTMRFDLAASHVRSATVDGVVLSVAAPAPPLARSRWGAAALAVVLAVAVAGGLGWRARARRLDPDTLVTAAGWALGEGDARRAVRWARRVLARDAADRDAAVLHVVALYHQGRHEEAVAWLRTWTRRHGDDPELRLALGLGVLATRGPDEAAVHVRRALDADPALREVLEGPHA